MKILVLNAGSSSQKSCLYELPDHALPHEAPHPLWEAQIDWTYQPGATDLTTELTPQLTATLNIKTHHGVIFKEDFHPPSRLAGVEHLLQTLWTGDTQVLNGPNEIDCVGHRVVHGGQDYRASTPITPEVKGAIARLSVFAPVHNPANLEGIEAIEHILGPHTPQIAVFDTAFHAHLPPAAYVYPGPYEWVEQGIRRYGFHGISHQYCTQRAAQILNKKVEDLKLITCHLGNGCSLAAVHQGRSVDTTMGFTPLDGLMMGSRSGSIDPGILIHLSRQNGYSADDLDHLLNRASGLQGISGVSNDLRQIQGAIAQGNSRAQLALDIYIHKLRSAIGSMLASLGGLDGLVFTAGMGEHSPVIRAGACEAFGFLGLQIDPTQNEQSPMDTDIATPESTVRVLIIHTQEDWAIAQECWHFQEYQH